jgi:hypothetical protein
MKILFLICGLKRSIDLVINNIKSIFLNDNINIIICLNDHDNNYNIDSVDNENILKKLYIKDIYDNQYRNTLNYSYKIYNGISIIPIQNKYDFYCKNLPSKISTTPLRYWPRAYLNTSKFNNPTIRKA